jgi:hypothetical protein
VGFALVWIPGTKETTFGQTGRELTEYSCLKSSAQGKVQRATNNPQHLPKIQPMIPKDKDISKTPVTANTRHANAGAGNTHA